MGTKEAYRARLAEMGITSRAQIDALKPQIREMWNSSLKKYMHEKQSEDISGDYIYNSRNVTESWIVQEGWNVKYSQYLIASGAKDSYDFTQFGDKSELHYEVLQGGGGSSRVRFCWFAPNENQNLDYCMQVMTSHDMFGCIGMRKSEYCILNKQYSPEEYEKIRSAIMTQMMDVPYVDAQGFGTYLKCQYVIKRIYDIFRPGNCEIKNIDSVYVPKGGCKFYIILTLIVPYRFISFFTVDE